ncbi:FtsX-like permease family protein [Chitinophaga sp. SYP-B3965]|uniref:ABC transporter permease n=1 Tax=Chitinophaga sp. SYP-B3965 TaxID=2663120 RepID=UPI00129A0307|nr:ABC transporter permease [Chitinophaga sp. SYP-B3965]MRG45872.1 FtsX-like permease family protein [Chitinophaga sp. SYP-B3965]
MFRNYLRIAWRNLLKNKTFSFINITGLAIGMASCIMIMLFVTYEKGFDSQHTKNIYRLCEVQKWEGMVAPQNVALSMYPMATALKREFPEVVNFVRVSPNDGLDINYGEKRIFLKRSLLVDSTFLQLFNFKLTAGDKGTALMKPGSIILSEETAVKMFGEVDPIGKTIVKNIGDTVVLHVTGVIKIPAESHFQFDALIPFSTRYNPEWEKNWGGNWVTTYLELAPHANIAGMTNKFPAFLKEHMAMDDRWKGYELFLQSLPDVHAGSTNITHDYINFQKFDKRYTYIFFIIGVMILIIACINFMNLSTARSAERAKEVGIRKSIGAHRSQLAWQFIGESVMLSFIALIFALLVVWFTLPLVSNFSERALHFPLFTNWKVFGVVVGGTVLLGILAGLYPAGYLSSFEPVKVLKGSIQSGRNKGNLRNALVVVQFTAAVFLIIATVFALKQLHFMQTKDRGFNGDQILLLKLDSETNGRYDAMKQELLGSSLITAVSASQQRLGANIHQGGVNFHGNGPVRNLATSGVVVDKDFIKLYKIPIIAGADFSKDVANNAKEYIINETLAKELLKEEKKGATMESLVGKMFGYGGMDSSGRIVGITKDFNFNTLHHKIETLMMFSQKDWGYSEMAIKLNGNKIKESMALVETIWNKHVVGHPFDPYFLDQHFAKIYQSDKQVSTVVLILAILAIIISCLGLFGLASHAAERRLKEIGIRKVLGATVQNIVTMMSKDFVKLVIIANLIAWPIAWFAVYNWLNDFAYRINISWWVFGIAGIIAVLIALCTVSYQAIRAGYSNPVNSLKMD